MEAYYAVGNTSYIVNASHPLTKLKHGEAVTIIYDPSMPEKGVVYSLWSYWISLPELALSVGLLAVLFLSSVFITGKNSNIPYTPEQLQKKRKYDL